MCSAAHAETSAARRLVAAALLCALPSLTLASEPEPAGQLTFAVERSFHDHAGPAVVVSVHNRSRTGVPVVLIACSFLLENQPQAGASKLVLDVEPGQTRYDELRAYGRADRADCYLVKGEETAETALLAKAAAAERVMEAAAESSPVAAANARNRRAAIPVSNRKPKEAGRANQNAKH